MRVRGGALAVPTDANSRPYNQIIKITVFGVNIFNQVSELKEQTTIHFSFFNYAVTGFGQVKIEYTTDINETSPVALGIEFGLIQHKNVITEEKKCGSTCKEVAGFTTGVDYSTVPPSCIACNSSLQLEFSPANGTCSCKDHFVQKNALCINCNIDLCGYCNSALTQCFQCVDNAMFKNAANHNLGCVCVPGFYRDDILCKACPPGCVNCTSSTKCGTCVDNSNTRLAPALSCACKPGFFENNTRVAP